MCNVTHISKIQPSYSPSEQKVKFWPKNGYYKTFIVYSEPLAEKYQHDPKYVVIPKQHLASPLEQKARRYWFEHGDTFNHLFVVEEKKAIRKIGKRVYQESITENRDRIIEQITREKIYPIVREELIAEYQEIYPRSWQNHVKKMKQSYYEMEYTRKQHLPGKFAHFAREYIFEVFYAKFGKQEFVYYGYSGTSGGREILYVIGQRFAQINEYKLIPTILFKYDKYNIFKQVGEKKNFVLIAGSMFDWNKYPKTTYGLPKIYRRGT